MPSENNNANQIVINGEEVINLRSDTVSSENLLQGETAHNKAGEPITGDLDPATKDDAYLVSDVEDDIDDDDYIPFNDVSDPDIIKKKTLFSSIIAKIKNKFDSLFANITGSNITSKDTFRENIHTLEYLGTDIPDNADLDTYTTAGNYRVVSDASGATIDNLPLEVCGKVVVFDNGNGGIEQFYFANHSPRIFVRTKFGTDAWTTWKELGEGGDSKTHSYELGVDIPANADLNTYATEGVYKCELTETARTMSNLPRIGNAREAFKLIVSKIRNSNNIMQTWISYIDNSMAYRTSNNNGTTWNTWTSVYSAIDNTIHVLNVKTGSWWSQFKYFINGDKRLRVNHSLDNGSTWNGDQILAYLDDLKLYANLKSNNEITTGDLNDYTTAGTFFYGAENSANIAHVPVTNGAGYLFVIETGSLRRKQIIYLRDSNITFERSYNTDETRTWTDWVRIATMNDISPSAVGNGYAVATVSGSAISATITGFKLRTGVIVAVRIPSQLLSSCTLNISNTGAKTISYWDDSAVSIGRPILAGDICTFMYDGTYYKLLSKDRTPTISLQDFVADTSGNMVLNWGYANNLACIKHNIANGKLSFNYYKNGAWRGDIYLADYYDIIHQTLGVDIPDNANLNDYKTNGIYNVNTHVKAQTLINVPCPRAGKLVVQHVSGNSYVIQTYNTVGSDRDLYDGMFRRFWSGSTWSAWYWVLGQSMSDGYIQLGINTTTSEDKSIGIRARIYDSTTAKSYTRGILRVYQDHGVDPYGFNMVLDGGGSLILGGGEAGIEHYNALTKPYTQENIFLTADGSIFLQANASTITNRVGFRLDTGGNLVPVKAETPTHGIGTIGTNDCNINAVYSKYGVWSRFENKDVKQANNGVTETSYLNMFDMRDKNNLTFAKLEGELFTDGRTGSFWYVKNYNSNGESVGLRGIRMYMNKSGVLTYVFDDAHNANATLGYGYGTCSTAEATTAKVVTLSNYKAVANGYVSVKFTYNVPANATLNINSQGAKNIWYRGVNIIANIIRAGDLATFIYDGTRYHLIGVDRTSTSKTYVIPWSNVSFSDVMTGYYNATSGYTCAIHLEGRTIIGEIEIALINNPNITVPSYNQTTTKVLCRLKTDIRLFNHFECHVDCRDTLYPAYIQNGTFNNETYLVIILRKAMPITANGNLRIQFTAYTAL